MKLLREIIKGESGQALPIVLILLALGGLLLAPALGYAATTLKVDQIHEQKMAELYAADAGIEDVLHKIVTDDPSLEGLGIGALYEYPAENLPVINNLQLDSITVTRLALVYGILGENEYKLGQPHAGWLQPGMPYEVSRTEDYAEYACDISIVCDDVSPRQLSGIGAFFSPFPGDENLIDCPYDVTPSGVITFDNLTSDSPEVKSTAGGWAVVWRWEKNQGPTFDTMNNEGSLSFKVKILDPDWELGLYFTFLTTKEQDISYSASRYIYRWVIKAEVGSTIVKSCIIEEDEINYLDVLTWEINPPV